jgi:hypothetical protein
MDGWFKLITDWVVQLIKDILSFIFDLVSDIFVYLVDSVLNMIIWVFSAIAVPDFFSTHSMANILGGADSTLLFFVAAIGIPEGLGLIAAAVAFRLVRKFATLFQW